MENILSTETAKQKLFDSLTDYTDWKFLKSSKCLRKRIGNMVFDFDFYFSKYNSIDNVVDVNCEFKIWSKELDKNCNINSIIGHYFMRPNNEYWYDISTQSKLEKTIDELTKQIDKYVIPVVEQFENDIKLGLEYLQETGNYDCFPNLEKIK